MNLLFRLRDSPHAALQPAVTPVHRAAPAAPLRPSFGGDVMLGMNTAAHRVHGLERVAVEAAEHRRPCRAADDEAAVVERHEQPAGADEAGRLVEARPRGSRFGDGRAPRSRRWTGGARSCRRPAARIAGRPAPRYRGRGRAAPWAARYGLPRRGESGRRRCRRGQVVLPGCGHREVGGQMLSSIVGVLVWWMSDAPGPLLSYRPGPSVVRVTRRAHDGRGWPCLPV